MKYITIGIIIMVLLSGTAMAGVSAPNNGNDEAGEGDPDRPQVQNDQRAQNTETEHNRLRPNDVGNR